MSPIYEFQCENGHIHERVLMHGSPEWQQEHPCPACGSLTTRVMSMPQPPINGGTPRFHKGGRDERR